ncbi:MAG TPA: OmpA family protein [Pyrinomonadaceae bacterium]|jgi:outer membrane protein OmpA-like peptidoglycan-associated protein
MKNPKLSNIVLILLFLFSLTIVSFGQVDVPRQTTAITYPEDEIVTVQFRGTTRFPRMKGDARIKRTRRNGTEIELSVSKMPRPFELGAGFATYVVWAVSPDGQIDNLGEIKRRGFFEFDSKISVTTPLQNFAIIITAEPHFLVRRPSRAIMLENITALSASGRVLATAKSVNYFGNTSDYFSDARTPEIAETDYSKTPSTILQAKQAVALARYAGAQRDAADELQTAETLMQNAENAWKAGRDEESVDLTARQAVSAAVKAEDTALVRKEAREKRNEKSRNDAELRTAEDKYQRAQDEITDLKAELAREQRQRELSERDSSNYNEQIRTLREENTRLRDEIAKLRADSEDAKTRLARVEGEKVAIEKQREQDERSSRLRESMPVLMQSLKSFGAVRQTERGIVLTLPENYFMGIRDSNLAATADVKISNLANVLANSTDYRIIVEAHTDNKGTPDELQTLTQTRAQTVLDKLAAGGVEASRVEVKGYGASLPVAPNTTNLNRAKNRRVDVILVPNL